MACATLKRTLDFDPLHSPGASPKRRRCTPLLSPSSPTSSMSTSCRQPSTFSPVTPKMSPGQLAANICLEWKRLKRRRHLEDSYDGAGTSSGETGESDIHVSDMIHQHSFPSHLHVGHYQGGLGSPSASTGTAGPAPAPHGSKEQPMFTLKQVIIICERMLKEQESRIREEYDKVLSCKLAEQYDAFVRFNQDQIHRRFSDSTASYVS